MKMSTTHVAAPPPPVAPPNSASPVAPLRADDIVRLLDQLETGAGLKLSSERVGRLERVVRQRVDALGLADGAAYCGLLAEAGRGPGELQTLIDLMTIGETYFFRTRDFTEVFSQRLLPEMVARKRRTQDLSLAVWSGASSTGEEPYSIAIWLLEAGVAPGEWQVEVLGTDINTEHLRRAREARYTPWSFRSVGADDPRLSPYIQAADGRFRVLPHVRSLVRFEPGNLARPPAPRPARGAWDAIFLRNVLMYLSRPVARQALMAAWDALDDHGYLFVGECETLAYLDVPFELHREASVFYYRKRPAAPVARVVAPKRPPAPAVRVRAGLTRTGGAPTGPLPPVPSVSTPPESAGRVVRLRAMAAAAADAERTDEAIVALEHVLALRPDDLDVVLDLADQLLIAARYHSAGELCARALEVDPIAARAHLLQGVAAHGLGEFDRAWSHFQHALFLDEEQPVAHYFAGKLAESASDHVGAVRAYRRALATAESQQTELLAAGLRRRSLVDALRGWLDALGGGKEQA